MDRPLKALEELGEEFERLARRRMFVGRLSLRASLLSFAAVASLSAGSLAASGLLTGDAVKDPPGPKPTANAGAGIPKDASARLTALRATDPDGGPPWGLRTLTTTRALGCVQVGRVVGGKLGVLGQDGAFADDGRFHPKGPEVQTGRDCQAVDGAGHLFLAVSYQGLPASGEGTGCLARTPPDRPAGVPAPTAPQPPLCPKRDLRILYYGTLGPKARSVSYLDDAGRLATSATAGPDGAYLVVLRPTAKRPAKGYFVPSSSPGSGLRSIAYRDGRVCRLRSPTALGGAKECPRVGYVAPRQRAIGSADVATPVRATFVPQPVHPAEAGAPGGHAPAQWALRILFTARHAAGPRSTYLVIVKVDHPTRCGNTGGISGPVNHNVRVGQRVTATVYLPLRCRTTVRGEVRYRPQTVDSDRDPFGVGKSVAVVGRFVASVPHAP